MTTPTNSHKAWTDKGGHVTPALISSRNVHNVNRGISRSLFS
jgi:hypothetical protein